MVFSLADVLSEPRLLHALTNQDSQKFLSPFKMSISSSDVLLLLLATLCLNIVSQFSRAVRTCVSRNASLVGIKCTVVETQRAEHAKEIVTGLSLSELQSFDGFVAVRS